MYIVLRKKVTNCKNIKREKRKSVTQRRRKNDKAHEVKNKNKRTKLLTR